MEREPVIKIEQTNPVDGLLHTIGLAPYTKDQLRSSYHVLNRAIAIGMQRTGEPTTEDGGVLAIPSPIEVITSKQLLAVPEKHEVFAVCWGGTTQRSGIVEKGEQEAYPTTLNRTPISKSQKTLSTEAFAALIGQHITDGIDRSVLRKRQDFNTIMSVGISLGVPQRNRIDASGVNAQIAGAPSNWNITDYSETEEQPYLGQLLINKLQTQGLGVKNAYFQPDPTAVAHDVPYSSDRKGETLPASIVAGTGTNASLFGRNLEVSTTSDIFPNDLVQKKMVELGYSPEGNLTKSRTGGQRIKLRVAAAMHVLADNNILPLEKAEEISTAMQDKENGPLVSNIARDDLSWNEFNAKYLATINPEEYEILRKVSARTLEQAGQILGVIVSSVANAAGYDGKRDANIPIEGTVLKQGYGVLGSVRDTMRMLMPEHNLDLHDASDFRGVAKFAMVQQQEGGK